MIGSPPGLHQAGGGGGEVVRAAPRAGDVRREPQVRVVVPVRGQPRQPALPARRHLPAARPRPLHLPLRLRPLHQPRLRREV